MPRRIRRRVRGGANWDDAPPGEPAPRAPPARLPPAYADEGPAYPGYLENIADQADEPRRRARAAEARRPSQSLIDAAIGKKPSLWQRFKNSRIVSRGLRAVGARSLADRAEQAGYGRKGVRRTVGGRKRTVPAKAKAALGAFRKILDQIRATNPGMSFKAAQKMASQVYHRK